MPFPREAAAVQPPSHRVFPLPAHTCDSQLIGQRKKTKTCLNGESGRRRQGLGRAPLDLNLLEKYGSEMASSSLDSGLCGYPNGLGGQRSRVGLGDVFEEDQVVSILYSSSIG